MRLTLDQAQAIRQRIHNHMGAQARIWLFGSRVDDHRLGGHVDLYVEPETAPDLTTRLRCRGELADALDLSVDLIVARPGQDLPIYRIAFIERLKIQMPPPHDHARTSYTEAFGTVHV